MIKKSQSFFFMYVCVCVCFNWRLTPQQKTKREKNGYFCTQFFWTWFSLLISFYSVLESFSRKITCLDFTCCEIVKVSFKSNDLVKIRNLGSYLVCRNVCLKSAGQPEGWDENVTKILERTIQKSIMELLQRMNSKNLRFVLKFLLLIDFRLHLFSDPLHS